MNKIDSKMTIQELLDHYPCATAAFIRRRMLCAGCPTQAFHTLEDVARIHGCSIEELCDAVQNPIQTK